MRVAVSCVSSTGIVAVSTVSAAARDPVGMNTASGM